jgi:hypothetical protein
MIVARGSLLFFVNLNRRCVAALSVTCMIGVASCATKSGPANKDLLTCASPDGKYVAAFFVESGGGAAGYQYEYVEVRDQGDRSKESVLSLKSGYQVQLTWLPRGRLRIAYPSDARVDHWQSWYDLTHWYEAQDNPMRGDQVELRPLPGVNGMFLHDSMTCPRDSTAT